MNLLNIKYLKEMILDEYLNALDISSSREKEDIRSCEQKLIKFDKKELEMHLQDKWFRNDFDFDFDDTQMCHAPCPALCVLLHLIHVFCIPGQEEKMKVVQVVLNEELHTMTDGERYDIFERYLSQRLKVKSCLTETDMLTGQIDRQHQFLMKLGYLNILCAQINDDSCKDFIQQNVDYLVSNIEGKIGSIPYKFLETENTKPISCTMLLCLLNWNIYKTHTQVTIQNKEAPASSSVATVSEGYSFMASKVSYILQKNLSTLSEDDIFTVFINCLIKMYEMKREIIEDDFFTVKIKPIHELILKLFNSENLCNENEDKTYKDFFHSDNDLIHAQIEKLVDLNKTKTKHISRLGLSKLEISDQTTAYTCTSPIKNSLSQMLLTLKTDCQDFINENALVFVSMVGTVMTRNNVKLLTKLCDVLLCIPFNKHHFHDVTGAINKLIKYYAEEVGIDEKICEWIILLGHRLLKNIKHTKDILNHSVAEEIQKDFQKFINFLDDLFTKAIHVGTTYDFLIKAFRTEPSHFNENEHCEYCGYETFSTKKTAEEERLKELWKSKLTCIVKTMQISSIIRKIGKNFDENITSNEICLGYNFAKPHVNFIGAFEAEVEKDLLKATTLEDKIKGILIIDEMVKKSQLSKMLVLLIMIFIVGTSTGHHKSAKLKKYLTLKYEYHMASLYLLWCSGDIEVHPGPSLNKKTLAHDSSIERRWIQNISPKIINRLPAHEQSKIKPIKKVRNDSENREHFKSLLKTCQEEKVHVPKMYLAELNAWETMEYTILHKLFVYRCEIETIIASLQDFFICGGSTKDLTDINVSLDTELKTNDITAILGKDHRPTDKSQLMVYITRHIAGISIKCAHEKDPDAKCDGLWDLSLKNWPKQIILFDPNNRGKYSKKYPGQKLISDQELVDMLLRLPQVIIPQKYKDIVDAFRTMRKSQKDKSINKQHKAELCTTFKRITSLEKLDYALKNLWESGIFTEEVHNNLKKWWTTGAVDTTDDQNVSQVDIIEVQKSRRPHILINISTKSITLIVEQTYANSLQVSYEFHFDDELVPLKTMATIVHQTTIRKPSSDSHQKVTENNQTYSITIPKDKMTVLNSHFPCDLYPNSQAILESDIKRQHKVSSQETAVCSTIHFDKPTSSTNHSSQWNQNIAISGQSGLKLCTPNQSKTNSDDTSSATKDSQSFDFHTQVSQTSDMGSSDSISSVNSKSGNDDWDQHNISNGGQVILTDSDYSSDSSNNFVSKTYMKKRKFIEEDRNETKKRKIPLLEDKKPKETNCRQTDCLMDNTAAFNKNREILPDWLLDIDLDSYDIDDQTFKVDLNALDNEDTELGKFLQDMIDCESEKNVTNKII